MKPCATGYETLSAYVDGELALMAENTLRRHLDVCESCRRKVEALLGLKEIVAAGGELRPVPHTLRERLGDLTAPLSGAWRRYLAPLMVTAATAAIVLAGSVWWIGSRSGGSNTVVDTIVADHIHFLQVETPWQISSPDPAHISSWFSDQLSFPVTLPKFSNAGLVGARLCSLWGHKVALAFYQTSGKRLSLFIMEKTSLPADQSDLSGCQAAIGNYQVCLLPAEGVVLALVGENEQIASLLPELRLLSPGSL